VGPGGLEPPTDRL